MEKLEFGVSPKQKSALNSIAILYLKKTTIGPKVISTIVHIKNLLQLKGIFEDEIEEILLTEEDPRIQTIFEKTGKDEFPVIFIQEVCIGTVSDLEDWVVSEKLDSLLEKVYTTQTHSVNRTSGIEKHLEEVKQQKKLLEEEIEKAEEQNNFGAVEEFKNSIFFLEKDLKLYSIKEKNNNIDRNSPPFQSPNPQTTKKYPRENLSSPSVIESNSGLVSKAVESSLWMMKGVSSVISSSVSSFLPWKTSTEASTSPLKEYKDERGSNFDEFEVMQINWYWRQQKRILRFSGDRFLRINPYSKELRAVHYYRTIQDIIITGKTFMTMSFNDASPPEYYQSVNMDKIVGVLIERAYPTVIPAKYIQE
jgi:glutaredoxin